MCWTGWNCGALPTNAVEHRQHRQLKQVGGIGHGRALRRPHFGACRGDVVVRGTVRRSAHGHVNSKCQQSADTVLTGNTCQTDPRKTGRGGRTGTVVAADGQKHPEAREVCRGVGVRDSSFPLLPRGVKVSTQLLSTVVLVIPHNRHPCQAPGHKCEQEIVAHRWAEKGW